MAGSTDDRSRPKQTTPYGWPPPTNAGRTPEPVHDVEDSVTRRLRGRVPSCLTRPRVCQLGGAPTSNKRARCDDVQDSPYHRLRSGVDRLTDGTRSRGEVGIVELVSKIGVCRISTLRLRGTVGGRECRSS
jgi:hypothetical protein